MNSRPSCSGEVRFFREESGAGASASADNYGALPSSGRTMGDDRPTRKLATGDVGSGSISSGEGSSSSGSAKGIFVSKFKSKFEVALNNSRMPHPFGRKVSAPLKAVLPGVRNDGTEGERVSALSDSFMDGDNGHFSQSIPEGEVADHFSGKNQDDTMKEIERVVDHGSAMYSKNERNIDSHDNAMRKIDRCSISRDQEQENMMEQEHIDRGMNRGFAKCSINEQTQDITMKAIEQVMSRGSAMYSINEGDARSSGVSVVMAADRVSTSDIGQLSNQRQIKEKVDHFNSNTSTSCAAVRIRAETAARHSPPVDNKAAAIDQFEDRVIAKMRQGNSCMKSPTEPKNQCHGNMGCIRAKMEQNNTASAHEQFENRLRDKLLEGTMKIGAAKHKPVETAKANIKYQDLIRAKTAQGRDSGATVIKSSLTLKKTAAANNRTSTKESDNFCQLRNRFRAEVELGDAENTGTKHPPLVESTASPDERFVSRLKAKAKEGNSCKSGFEETKHLLESRTRTNTEEYSSSNGTSKVYTPSTANKSKGGLSYCDRRDIGSDRKGLADAGEHFEDRLKAKLAQCNTKDRSDNPSIESTDSANNQCEQRKTMNADLANCRICSDKTSSMMRDKEQTNKDSALVHGRMDKQRFDARIKAKLEKGNMTPPKEILSSAMGGVHSPSAEDRFESRLRMKIGKGSKIDNAAIEKSLEPVTPLDRFDMRLREKMEKGKNCDNIAVKNSRLLGSSLAVTEQGTLLDCFNENDTIKRIKGIWKILGDKPSLPSSIITLAFEKIWSSSLVIGESREMVAFDYNWVKVLATIMSNHPTDETLQVAALRTIWIIMSIDSMCGMQFGSNQWDFILSGLELLTDAMRNHRNTKQFHECFCAIVSLLSSSPDQASYLLSFNNGSIVDRLCEALFSNSTKNALHALYKLLVVPDKSKSSCENLLETIGHCTNRERQGGDMLTNAMDTILGVMSACPEDCEVHMRGCYLLWALLSHENLLDCGQNSLSSLIINILRHLEVTTTAPGVSLVVHGSAICLLSRMSNTRRSLLMGKDEIFSRIVVRIMMARPKSRVVALHGCSCISNALCILDDSLLCAILGVMNHSPDEEVADKALNSILLLAGKEYQTILTLLKNDNLIGSIVETMSRHPNSPSIQIAACNILSSIALDRHVIREMCSCGGANRIISNLYNLSQERLAVCKAFVALSNILGIVDISLLQESRAPKCVLRAMEANPKDLVINIRGTAIIWNLASFHSSLKRDIIHFEGIRIVSHAMSSFIASEPMQEKGVLVLWTLSVPQPLNSVMTMCSIEVITNAIAAHLPCAKICEHGLGALSTLASSKSQVKNIDNLIDLIVSSMWMHSDSATVQQGALASLSKISVDQSTNEVLQITPDDIDVVINAMRTHLHVKGVQENAIILLRSFTFCPANLHVLGQNPFLVGLVKSSLSKFSSLRVDAGELLRLLPTDAQ